MAIDLRTVILEIVQLVRSRIALTEFVLARALQLDISSATVTRAKSVIAATGATMADSMEKLDFAIQISVPRTIFLVFENRPPAGDLSSSPLLGVSPRIQNSQDGSGRAIVFDFEDVSAGVTVSNSDGLIDTVFCRAP